MVDKLKRALEQLEQPVCPSCHIEMKWTRSALVAPETISHLFHCPNCHRTEETTSRVKVVPVPPDKLAAPVYQHAA